jgi:hypothetical protein
MTGKELGAEIYQIELLTKSNEEGSREPFDLLKKKCKLKSFYPLLFRRSLRVGTYIPNPRSAQLACEWLDTTMGPSEQREFKLIK